LLYIEADLNLAEAGLKGKRANKWTYLLIIWHCQQAVEKSLKMYSIENGKELLLTHDLPRLLRYSDLKDEKNYSKFIIELNRYYAKPRYPDAPLRANYPAVSLQIAKDFYSKAKGFCLWIKK